MIATKIKGAWTITRIILEHNHKLSPPSEKIFLRSHKLMTSDEKLMIRTCNSVNIPNRKIMAMLSFMRGQLKDLPCTAKHVSN